MNWVNLQKCLEEYSLYLQKAFIDNMPSYYELRNNILFRVNISEYIFEINFEAPEYWKWTNDGRKAGKMPPKEQIDEWISRRSITPYALKNGKLPTRDQLSFLIRRKIGRDGTEGSHFYEKSIEEQADYWENKIADAIGNDISDQLTTWLSPLNGPTSI